MSNWFIELDPIRQVVLVGGVTWLVTAVGAALVFPFRRLPASLLDPMLGFAAGVMIAASFWSLLVPAIEIAGLSGRPGWLPALIGFLAGGAFLRLHHDRLRGHDGPARSAWVNGRLS